jgi:hypothetical protein
MSPPIAELKAAIAAERLARMAGTILFVWGDEVMILHRKKNSPHLEKLCGRYHDAIRWLLEARAPQ